MGEGIALRLPRLSFLLLFLQLAHVLNVAAKGGDVNMTAHVPYTTILFPGFASSRLRAWADLDCPLSPLDFHPLDYVSLARIERLAMKALSRLFLGRSHLCLRKVEL